MGNDFITLSDFFRQAPLELPAEEAMPQPACTESPDDENAANAALEEVKRFRAGLADAADVLLAAILRDVAADVLGRELQIAPVDVGAIVARSVERFADRAPVSVCVHPDDAAAAANVPLPVACDAALRRGDAVLALREGTIDLRLGTRLRDVLEAYER